MLTNDDYRRILQRPDMTEDDANRFRKDLEVFLNQALDVYFAEVQASPPEENGTVFVK